MPLRIQPLTHDSSQSLCDLFATEKGHRFVAYWQDRSPDFFAYYEAMTPHQPLVFGFFANEKLIGCSALVPLSGITPILEEQTVDLWLDTDCFIHPLWRGRGLALEMIRLRQHWIKDHLGTERFAKAFFFGVENQPSLFDEIQKHSDQYLSDFSFGSETTLYECLVGGASGNLQQGRLSADFKWQCRECTKGTQTETIVQSDNRHLIALFPHESAAMVQRHRRQGIKTYQWVVQRGERQGECFVVSDFNAVRRFRWNQSVAPALLEKSPLKSLPLKDQEVVRSLVMGPIDLRATESPVLGALLMEFKNWAQAHHYHLLYIRDWPEAIVKEVFPEMEVYRRRILFWSLQESSQMTQLVKQLEKSPLGFQLHGFYL